MKSFVVTLVVFVCCTLLAVGTASAQVSVGSATGTNVAYAASLWDASSGEGAGPSLVGSGIALETAQVRAALDKFTRNFELRDVDRLKSESWPSMSPKAYKQLKNTFTVLSQITLAEDCAATPVVVSDSADWACSERLGYRYEGGPRYSQTHALAVSSAEGGGEVVCGGKESGNEVI